MARILSEEQKEKARQRARDWRAANLDYARERASQYSASHREEARLRASKWHKENPERHRERAKAYRERNREQLNLITRIWKKKNHVQVLAIARSYKARKRGADGRYCAKDVSRLYENQCGKCAACKIELLKYHVDHVVPLCLGGTNYPENLQLLCPTCNLRKGRKMPEQFMKEMEA